MNNDRIAYIAYEDLPDQILSPGVHVAHRRIKYAAWSQEELDKMLARDEKGYSMKTKKVVVDIKEDALEVWKGLEALDRMLVEHYVKSKMPRHRATMVEGM